MTFVLWFIIIIIRIFKNINYIKNAKQKNYSTPSTTLTYFSAFDYKTKIKSQHVK